MKVRFVDRGANDLDLGKRSSYWITTYDTVMLTGTTFDPGNALSLNYIPTSIVLLPP